MKIGIIGAMDVEVALLKEKMDIFSAKTYAGMEFAEGTLNGRDAVVVKCGIGKVNAGVCVQILCSLFGVTHVINTGVAGSLNNDLDIGDILVSEDAVYHDMDVTVFGYQPGEVPGIGFRCFKADEAMKQAALDAVKAEPGVRGFAGRVVSGDQFISDDVKKAWLKETFSADCTEMEGAAIAHVCYLNKVPFVIIRAISDKADGSGNISYKQFEEQAAHRCAEITMNMAGNLK